MLIVLFRWWLIQFNLIELVFFFHAMVHVDISAAADVSMVPEKGDLKRERDPFLVNDNETGELFPNKKQAKQEEASNDDTKSEVSNPVIISVSPKDNGSSSHDISEESPTNACPSSEETLTVSKEGGSSSSEDNTSHQSPRNDSCDFVSMSPVVLEIPKHASTTGVRKITFKFSKRKEDYDTKTSLSHPLHDGTDRGLLYHRNEDYYPRNHSVWVDSCTERPQVGERYMELNMSKKVVPNNYPTNVKKLLATGILDRARVKYICFSSEVISAIVLSLLLIPVQVTVFNSFRNLMFFKLNGFPARA